MGDDLKDVTTSTWLQASNGFTGDMYYDAVSNSITVNNGGQYGSIVLSNHNAQPAPLLTLKDGNIQIGDLVMNVEHFEICMRHLLEITRRDKPEEFI